MTDSKMPERIWAWHWEVDRHRGQWSEDQEIVGESSEYIRADLAHPAPVVDAELEADDSLCSRIGEVANQIHNIACEHQEDNNLSERLSELRGELWNIATALRARTAQPVWVGWQPIESAEHDEENYILVFTETGFCEVCRVGWFEDGEPVWFNDDCRVYPTHWMPLPGAPALLPDGGA